MDSLNVLTLTGNPLRCLGQAAINSGTQTLKALLRERHQPEVTQDIQGAVSSAESNAGKIEAVSSPYDHLPAVVPNTGILDWGLSKKQAGGGRFAGMRTAQCGEAENKGLPPLNDQDTWKAVAFKGSDAETAVKKLILSGRQLGVFPMGYINWHLPKLNFR